MCKHLLLAKCYDKRNRLISSAFNLPLKSHPLMTHFAKLVNLPEKDKLHAEILAIIRAKDIKIHGISVERYGKNGQMLLAKPCSICQKAIEVYGIKNVSYTTEEGWVEL
jgi:tRNA(Arg) A34 adenosine deaminase TadA